MGSRPLAWACVVFALLVGKVGAQVADPVPEGLSAADWDSIREVHESNRHVARPVDGGYLARNPGQRWTTTFDGRGFLIRPDTGGWSWGLELLRYGFMGQECEVTRSDLVSAECERVTYTWDDVLEEWYVNDTRGLEHGYTVHKRPFQSTESGPLILTLAVRGDLLPEVQAGGRCVRFATSDGASVITYSGLMVFDADGQVLPARFERTTANVQLIVDEVGARYPLTIDPLAQQAYLKASNTEGGQGDFFGISMAVSGDTVVVGAHGEDSSATGINGDQSDNSALQSGAAYVFVRNGTSWSQEAYLKASNTDAGDRFGYSVSVSGDTVVVGTEQEESSATGVNGDQGDNSASFAGAAYVFVRNGTSWSQQAYLKASNTDAEDHFGISVAVSGDTVVVGAFWEDSSATGIDGDQSDNSASRAGAAYVFVRNGTSWSQEAYLKASNTDAFDDFGYSVSVSGDTVVVGAVLESSSATGVNGDQSDNSASAAGAVYAFVRNGTIWSQEAYLKASNTNALDFFGESVAVSGDTVVVGADNEDSTATGVDGDQSNNNDSDAGAAYVFVRSGTRWSQQAYLKASNTDQSDQFGESVAVSGDTVVVGAWREASSATGIDGDQSDNSASAAGAAYVFVRNGTSWSQEAYLKASNTDADDRFGSSVAVSGDTVVIAAPRERSSATGVDGDQSDNSTIMAGAAYVFTLIPAGTWFDLGFGLPGTTGEPELVGSGTLLAGDPVTLSLTGALAFAPAFLVLGLSELSAPFKQGVLVPAPDFLIALTVDGFGEIIFGFPWPSGVPSGASLWWQYWIQDAAGPAGFAASNGIVGTTP